MIVLILILIGVIIIIIRCRYNSNKKRKIKKNSDSLQKSELIYEDMKCANDDYAEPQYDQQSEDGNRYEYSFSSSPKLSTCETTREENLSPNPIYDGNGMGLGLKF